MIAGARVATGEILVVMDADLSHPPREIPRLVQPLLERRADMVIGSRYVTGGTTPGWPIYRKIMSRVAAAAAYPLTGVHDSMCGFFAIRRKLLLQLAPAATGFKIAFEAIVRGGRGLRVMEIPIAFVDRARGKSKMDLGDCLAFLDALERRGRAPTFWTPAGTHGVTDATSNCLAPSVYSEQWVGTSRCDVRGVCVGWNVANVGHALGRRSAASLPGHHSARFFQVC